MNEKSFRGSATTSDGRRINLTCEEANALWEYAEKEKAQRAVDMPNTPSALAQINRAKERLRDLDWKDGIYCPKDGSEFACVQFGSQGIFSGYYVGKWPEGSVYLCDYLVQPAELMWKPMIKLTSDERKHLENCMEEERKAHERELEMFAQMDQMGEN